MKGVVPAAGKGTRLRPLTDDQPKGLVHIAGQPLLTHVFETLLEAGVDELVVIVGYHKAQIIERYGDAFRDIPVTYVHQREQRGLGHAVSLTESAIDGPFVVLNGDNVFAGSIRPAVERFEKAETDAVLLVEDVDRKTAQETGVLDLEAGVVTGIVEKPSEPPSRLVTTGCYVLPTEIFHALELTCPSKSGEYELSEAVGLLAAAGLQIEPVQVAGPRINVNTADDLERATRLLGADD